MGHAAEQVPITADRFIAWDATQSSRHAFVAGEIFAMAGAEDLHVTVALNVAFALRQQPAGSPCRVFMSDMKLRIAAADCDFYPDVMVTCGSADRRSPNIKSEAKLVVEALSGSTAAFDRGDKFAAYRQLLTLEENGVVDIDCRRADLYRTGSDGLWVLHPSEAGQSMVLASVAVEISAAQLLAEIDTDPFEG